MAVAASAVIVALVALALGIGWLASLHSRNTTYSYGIPLKQVDVRLSSGNAVIVGTGSSMIRVLRTDDYAFGHSARERRSLSNGTLRLTSSCPRIVVGSCSASYEIAVPETARINVRTTAGDIRLSGFRGTADVATRSGNVDVEAYCGFDLSATSRSGNVRVAAACAPQHLTVKSGSGDASAQVPPGRYRISTSAGGTEHVAGIVRDRNAPFTIDAHSAGGNVAVEGGL